MFGLLESLDKEHKHFITLDEAEVNACRDDQGVDPEKLLYVVTRHIDAHLKPQHYSTGFEFNSAECSAWTSTEI